MRGQENGQTARTLDLEWACAAFEWRIHLLRNWIARRKQSRKIAKVERILAARCPSCFHDSDELFETLQGEYPALSQYGYDGYSVWRRASERAQSLLSLPELQIPGSRILEIAAGDGMVGRLLSDYGHDVTLCDIEDWRDDRASHLTFLQCDVCHSVPFDNGFFDLIYSYNAMEHLADPYSALGEIERLCRPGGFVRLCFGPLYCSPWGLHAYRALRMPYPQFLFSRPFIDAKVQALRVYDLGREMEALQSVNCWRLGEFAELWNRRPFEVIEQRFGEDWTHLGVVLRFPDAFQGRNLQVTDLVVDSIDVLLKKAG